MNHKFQYFLHFRMRQRTAVAVNAPLTPPQYLLPAPAKGGLPQTNTFGKRPHLCLRGFSERWYPWDQPWANDGWSLRIILHRSTLRYRGPREDQRSLTRTVTCLMINASLRSAFSFVSYFPTCSNFTYLSNALSTQKSTQNFQLWWSHCVPLQMFILSTNTSCV